MEGWDLGGRSNRCHILLDVIGYDWWGCPGLAGSEVLTVNENAKQHADRCRSQSWCQIFVERVFIRFILGEITYWPKFYDRMNLAANKPPRIYSFLQNILIPSVIIDKFCFAKQRILARYPRKCADISQTLHSLADDTNIARARDEYYTITTFWSLRA